jgi:hypothetical protein
MHVCSNLITAVCPRRARASGPAGPAHGPACGVQIQIDMGVQIQKYRKRIVISSRDYTVGEIRGH